MTCSRCGAQIPAGRLVCPCFEARADEECFKLAIQRLQAGQGYLYLTPRPWKHLLPTSSRGLTFCGAKRYKQASTVAVDLGQLRRMDQKDCCIECYARATMWLATTPPENKARPAWAEGTL